MQVAWEDVRSKKGSPGVDEITVARWGRNWEANIERIIEQVTTNNYHPSRPRRINVVQKNGKLREISLLTVTDKVLQRAFLNIIEPEFERRFLKCSYGYRKNRSTATAIQQLLNYRDKGFIWLLDADLVDCFGNIDHSILIGLFKRVINDQFVESLLNKWLVAGRKYRHQAVGIPQGGVISPLLCNIYLHQLDAKMTCARWNHIRYADDFVVMTTSQEQAEIGKEYVGKILTSLRLEFHPDKTKITSFEEGFTFLGVDFLNKKYQYIWQNKRIEVENRELQILYKHMPEFYSRGN
ncbi:MAG: reverse transcriptase domain-containing protein [Anaerolineaceae bacterium]